jgi:hypothetical protein
VEIKPSAASLIQSAAGDGRLDDVTALEYRAMAMFGLPGLPEEFAQGVRAGDSAVLAEMAAIIGDLPAPDQERLRPYLLRPTQPGSVFYAPATANSRAKALAPGPQVQAAPSACHTWHDSGDLDNRFKVWACADTDSQAADVDIAVIVTMVQSIWGTMSGDMGKPPKSDANPNEQPVVYGGDGRIDFYALHDGGMVYRDGQQTIPAGAAAATVPADPISGSASSFVLLNADTLEENENSFKQDLIHEFFHVLQDAHNFEATVKGTTEHWFVEASATWAETYYMREASWVPHWWFHDFQESRLGLQADDPDHQYASYVWPFFMEQQSGATAVFNAWKATDQIAAGDFTAMTAAVNAQLPFDANFHEFGVRNVNLNSVLRPASVTRYDELDANFYDDVSPFVIIPAPVSPGSPYVSGSEQILDLSAHYFQPTFSHDSRKVTISIANLQPSSQVDGDFLAHYSDGSWKRLPLSGGVLKFCRDDDGWDIDSGILVVSNHSAQGVVSGTVEIDAKNQCTGDVRLHGTFTGHYSDFAQDTTATFDVIVVWHRPNDIHDPLNFQFESGNFTFTTTVSGVCGGTINEGTRMELWGEDGAGMIYGEPQDRSHEIHALLIDNRLNQGGLEFSFGADWAIPNGSVGCEPPYDSHGSVPWCQLEFRLATLDTLQPDASCEEGDITWTGHLVEI